MKLWIVLLATFQIVNGLNYKETFDSLVESIWSDFWYDDKSSWSSNNKCVDKFNYPVVWDQAVAGRAITEHLDQDKIRSVVNNLKDYLNSDGWFSSSTAKDNDVYIDDNAQVLWVLVDAYQFIGDVECLNIATKLMSNIKGQQIQGGGVRWNLNGDYVASISTSEAALAAVRLYQVNNDQSLIDFATSQMDWLFDNLQDPSDGLIYDGKVLSTGNIDKGKLVYSVGTMVSTLSYLSSLTGDSKYYYKALDLLNSALNPKGAFYNSDGTWNNPLKYSHLLFMGISDLITVYTASNKVQSSQYQKFISEMEFQANHIFENLQIDTNNYVDNTKVFKDSGNYCNGKPVTGLMDNVSAAQIYYAMSRVA
ncbi:hypothetical protein CLIB1444_02S05050 [[Candida] jaroonii]|uniref:Uncharacterized protein n=1 Tax=[Candida] jaroonii TaxID=467808 RepID=A0ACA9Y2U5_9ASCO|nr:hypothetical protein CLIB1444_02S05050 [[Candida] jaroonii]